MGEKPRSAAFAHFHGVKGFPWGLSGKESGVSARDAGSIPGPGRHLEKGQQPAPVFSPGNPMDGGAWWATVHGVTESGATETEKPPQRQGSKASHCGWFQEARAWLRQAGTSQLQPTSALCSYLARREASGETVRVQIRSFGVCRGKGEVAWAAWSLGWWGRGF